MIKTSKVTKSVSTSEGTLEILHPISFEVKSGESVAIIGASGSGKSTLLGLLAGLDEVSQGEIHLDGEPLHTMDEEARAVLRGQKVGFIFQSFMLVQSLTAIENVMLPMDFCNTYPARERRIRAISLLEKVGISEQANKLPADLSGGQQQRAAIARALANDPPILVADEPTGNLDSQTSEDVMRSFAELAKEGKTVVMVTHERDLNRYFTRSITLADGVVVSENGGGL